MDRLADLNRDAKVMRFITGRPSSIDETAVELEVALGTRWLVLAREDGGFLGWGGAIDSPRTTSTTSAGDSARGQGHGYAVAAARELIAEKSPPAMLRTGFLLRPRVNAASAAAVTRRRTPWPSSSCSSTTGPDRRRHGAVSRAIRRAVGRWLARDPYREELLSYLFFRPKFIDGAIRPGQNDGRCSLDSAGGVRWRFTGESAATA